MALEKAVEMHPEVKRQSVWKTLLLLGGYQENQRDLRKAGSAFIENVEEAVGAPWDGAQCGTYRDYSAGSYNGNKMIMGSSSGCLLTNNIEGANQARKWSTQARENATWYQHIEVGYNYRMSKVIAGMIRG